jgi:hypothetical protein
MKESSNAPEADLKEAYRLWQAVLAASEHIERLGKFLAHRVRSFPNFIAELCVKYPSVPMNNMRFIHAVGVGKLYVPLVMSMSVGARRLMSFPIEVQRRLWDSGVRVWIDGQTITMHVDDLTPKLIRRVFTQFHVRTPDEQEDFATKPSKSKIAALPSGPRYFVDIDKGTVTITRNTTLQRADIVRIGTQILSLDDVLNMLSKVRTRGQHKKAA